MIHANVKCVEFGGIIEHKHCNEHMLISQIKGQREAQKSIFY